jgi:hypothetical protein
MNSGNFLSFIDIIYAVVIGTGFTNFPYNPKANVLGTFMFMYTLFVTAHDWYEYHHKFDRIPQKRRIWYFFIQICVLVVLNQMFKHSTSYSLVMWLSYVCIFCLLNTIWNLITPFENHRLYALTSIILALITLLMVVSYQSIIGFIPVFAAKLDGRWIIPLLAIITPCIASLVEYKIVKKTEKRTGM